MCCTLQANAERKEYMQECMYRVRLGGDEKI